MIQEPFTDVRNPARQAAADPTAGKYVALFIDWENIKYSLRERGEEPDVPLLTRTAAGYGRLVVARAYADWQDYDHRRSHDPMRLYRAGIEPVYVPGRSSPYSPERVRNSVDVKMAADCVEVSFTHPHINTFVLVSGDHSVVHIINSLRLRGSEIVVIGVAGNTAEAIGQRVDRLVFYHDLLDPGSQEAVPSQQIVAGDLDSALQVLVGLTRERRDKGYYPLLSWLGLQMPLRVAGFRPQDYGFVRFGDLVRDAEQKGILRVVRINGQDTAVLPDDELLLEASGEAPTGSGDAASPAQPPPGADQAADLSAALDFLVDLVREQRERGSYPLLAGLGGQMTQRLSGFRAENYGFARFGDLVRYAEQQGRVKIVARGKQRFVLPPGDELPALAGGEAPEGDEWVFEGDDPDDRIAPERLLSDYEDVYGDITRTADELEGRYPYVTAKKVAQSVWNKGHRDPRALPPDLAPVSPRARRLDAYQIQDFVTQAVEQDLFTADALEFDGRQISVVRLNRAHPFVEQVLARGGDDRDGDGSGLMEPAPAAIHVTTATPAAGPRQTAEEEEEEPAEHPTIP